MSLQTLKQSALGNTAVKAEYEQLEAEFRFIDQQLSVPLQVGSAQNTLGKNTDSEEQYQPLRKR